MADIYLTDEPAGKLPFSLEAEQSVLGAILLDPDCIRDVANAIKGILAEETGDCFITESSILS